MLPPTHMLGVLDILIFRGLFCWYDYIHMIPYPCDDDDKKREREKKKMRSREGERGEVARHPSTFTPEFVDDG